MCPSTLPYMRYSNFLPLIHGVFHVPISIYCVAVWSKVSPLTTRCLSPLPGFESRPGHVSDLGLGGGFSQGTVVFARYCGFLHYLQLARHKLATIGINVTKNEIPNSK